MSGPADTGVAPQAAAGEPSAAGGPSEPRETQPATTASSKGLFFVRRVTAMQVLVAILVGQVFSFYHNQVAAIFGLLWLLLQLAVIRSMVSAELASTAARLQDASSGGAYGAHQV